MIVFLAAISFAIFFNMTGLPQSWHLNFKPFNCVPCLSFWISVCIYQLPIEIVTLFATIFGAGVTGAVIYRLIHKL
jgi:hypothetical protein